MKTRTGAVAKATKCTHKIRRRHKYDTKYKAKLWESNSKERKLQLEAAVAFCKENNCRGQRAIIIIHKGDKTRQF